MKHLRTITRQPERGQTSLSILVDFIVSLVRSLTDFVFLEFKGGAL